MSNKSPIFSMAESQQHFSDYGFDPQIGYFQVLEEARKHKRETTSSRSSIDALHFKLQKPISKDDSNNPNKRNKKKRWWWRNALLLLKRFPNAAHLIISRRSRHVDLDLAGEKDVHRARARAFRACAGSISGPVYVTESRSGSSTPYRAASGPLKVRKDGDVELPYLSLRELNMEQQQRSSTSSAAMPIYLVT